MQEKEIKVLFNLKESLKKMVQTKTEQIQLIENEIGSLTKQCDMIDYLISDGSFISAANLIDAETAASDHQSQFQNLEYTQKIFSPSKELLTVLQFQNNSVFIRFPNPGISKINQEIYINEFVKPHLVSLKKIEHDLTPNITKNIYDSEEYLDSITLSNISNFESFEYIVESINEIFKNQFPK
ncbi:hypothetical protein NEF87_004037 [Candidatus Lokiarchaeum ossiferum]|uniref:Uncharacterized protein n=1 Tax=Candidatus Lokiarchaeum ossiferum TaxID=2951803 RepID=A0ABY6HZI1_9ARCH|nr:hypothetical protein NEF87_004037 [Candidatus Lokiarchaeum sp. B-35]